MKNTMTNTFAVTISFAIGALLIAGSVWTLWSAGIEPIASAVDQQQAAVLTLVVNATLAGLFVDGLRYLGDYAWPKGRASQ